MTCHLKQRISTFLFKFDLNSRATIQEAMDANIIMKKMYRTIFQAFCHEQQHTRRHI